MGSDGSSRYIMSMFVGAARNNDALGLGRSAAGDKNKGFDWAKVKNLKNVLVILGIYYSFLIKKFFYFILILFFFALPTQCVYFESL